MQIRTNALMTNCLVESTMFKSAKIDGFQFIDNYMFGTIVGQEHFEQYLINR